MYHRQTGCEHDRLPRHAAEVSWQPYRVTEPDCVPVEVPLYGWSLQSVFGSLLGFVIYVIAKGSDSQAREHCVPTIWLERVLSFHAHCNALQPMIRDTKY